MAIIAFFVYRTNHQNMKTISYQHPSVRIIVSFLVSLFIVLNGRWHQIGEAIMSPLFYVAFTVSFTIAFFLLYVVHTGNKMLNKYSAWNKNFYLRLLLQILLGILLPAILDIILVAVFLKAKHSEMDMRVYLIHDFPIIVLLLVLMNGYYTLTYILQKNAQKDVSDTIPDIDPSLALCIQNGNKYIKLNIRDEVLYCCRMGRSITVYTTDGDAHHLYQSLSSLLSAHHEAGLIQINRSILLNKHIVQGYERGQRRNTLQVIVKKNYVDLPAMKNLTLFVVTKEHLDTFKQYFHM